MSTIRKILILVMLASMILAACGPSETQAPAATQPPAVTLLTVPEVVGALL